MAENNQEMALISMLNKHEEQLNKLLGIVEQQAQAVTGLQVVQEGTGRKLQMIADAIQGLMVQPKIGTPQEVATQGTDGKLIKGMEQLSIRTGVPHKFGGGESEDLESWIFKMEKFFHKAGVTEEELKLDLACEGLDGMAFQFFQIQFKAGKLMSWTQLTSDLKRRFNHMKSPIQLG